MNHGRGSNLIEIFKEKSKASLAELKIWSREEFCGRERKPEQLQTKLNEVKFGYNHVVNGEEITKIENQIDNILLDKEVYWKQRSRADWLRKGDKNTKNFHSKASTRRRKNMISGLEDENSRWVKEVDDVNQMVCEYFTNIFSTTNPSSGHISTILSKLPAKATGEMVSYMDQPFTKEEVADALAQMCPTKAPNELPARGGQN